MSVLQSAQAFVNKFLNIFHRDTSMDLQSALQKVVDQARRNASWSSSIPDAISVGRVVEHGTLLECSIIVNLKEGSGAPEAAAFEYGSGEHATRNAGKYLIKPKNVSALAFFWPGHEPPYGSRKFIGIADDGRYLFKYVEHPGVEARPYLAPAIKQLMPEVRKVLAKSFKDAYLEASFTGK